MYMSPTGLVLKIKLHVKLIFSIKQAIYTLGHIVEHCDAWGYLKLYLYSYCLPVSVYLFVFRVFYISKFQMHWHSLVFHLKNMKCSNSKRQILTMYFLSFLSIITHPTNFSSSLLPLSFCPITMWYLSNKVRTKCPQVSHHLVQCHRLVSTLSDFY